MRATNFTNIHNTEKKTNILYAFAALREFSLRVYPLVGIYIAYAVYKATYSSTLYQETDSLLIQLGLSVSWHRLEES